MPTRTAPKSAGEARALAERLEAQERDLSRRRSAARRAAEIDVCRERLGSEADALRDAADAAHDDWLTAKSDPSVGLDDLFGLWQTLRIASARRATHVGQLSGRWDDLEPIQHDRSGQPLTHRGDLYDPMEPRGELTFAHALEDVLAHRVAMAAGVTRQDITLRLMTAADEAAEAVK